MARSPADTLQLSSWLHPLDRSQEPPLTMTTMSHCSGLADVFPVLPSYLFGATTGHTQGSILVEIRGSHGIQPSNPDWLLGKANTLPTVLWLCPHLYLFGGQIQYRMWAGKNSGASGKWGSIQESSLSASPSLKEQTDSLAFPAVTACFSTLGRELPSNLLPLANPPTILSTLPDQSSPGCPLAPDITVSLSLVP